MLIFQLFYFSTPLFAISILSKSFSSAPPLLPGLDSCPVSIKLISYIRAHPESILLEDELIGYAIPNIIRFFPFPKYLFALIFHGHYILPRYFHPFVKQVYHFYSFLVPAEFLGSVIICKVPFPTKNKIL